MTHSNFTIYFFPPPHHHPCFKYKNFKKKEEKKFIIKYIFKWRNHKDKVAEMQYPKFSSDI